MHLASRPFITAALPAGLICFLAYLRAVNCDFVLWDDTEFVVNNPAIRNFDYNLFKWAFTTVAPFSGIWIPLTWISFAVDYHFWGLNPSGYHLTNIILHSINVMLVVLIADSLCRSIFLKEKMSDLLIAQTLIISGLIFGLHPLRVESVAWISERKDVLNGVFVFSSLLFYVKYLRGKEAAANCQPANYYALSLICFLLSLMAKPVSIVLPLILLVIDWYLDRLRKHNLLTVLWEKAPYFLFSAGVALATLWIASGNQGILVSLAGFPPLERIAVSGNALFQYLRLFLFPVGIVQYAPMPTPLPYSYLVNCAVVIMLLGAVAISKRRTLIAATLCFLIPLVPTLAFFQNNDHAYAVRYTYLPMALPGIAIVCATAVCYRRTVTRPARWFMVIAITVLLIFHVSVTEKLIGVWKNTGTFWARIIEVTPIGRAYQERGLYYFEKEKYPLAIEDLTKAIEIAYGSGEYTFYNLNAFRGEALRLVERYAEAAEDFTYAISIAPHPAYYYHRGLALQSMGLHADAEKDFLLAGNSKGAIEWY